jgi:hypothetical protein
LGRWIYWDPGLKRRIPEFLRVFVTGKIILPTFTFRKVVEAVK